MKIYLWKYTQFAQFNTSDTMLLVSGVHPGDNGTMGEIAVFSTQRELTVGLLQVTLVTHCQREQLIDCLLLVSQTL